MINSQATRMGIGAVVGVQLAGVIPSGQIPGGPWATPLILFLALAYAGKAGVKGAGGDLLKGTIAGMLAIKVAELYDIPI